MRYKAIHSLDKNATYVQEGNNKIAVVWKIKPEPTELEILAKEKELQALEPMRLLREYRDAELEATDWRAMSDRTMTQAEIDKRQFLREIPDKIKSGVLPAPTLDENDQLVWDHWPVF